MVLSPADDDPFQNPSPPPIPSTDAERRTGVLSDLTYRNDGHDLFERGKNVVRYFRAHFAEYHGKLVAMSVIVDEIRAAIPSTTVPFTDLGLFGLVIGVRLMNLLPQKRKAGSNRTYRTYVLFSDENLAKCREWIRRASQRDTGDIIG